MRSNRVNNLINGNRIMTHEMTTGSPNGPVITYTLPPDELERYRSMKIPPARNSNGKPIKKGGRVS